MKWEVTTERGNTVWKNKHLGEKSTGERQIRDHGLVPDPEGYVTALTPEQREILMGFPQGHTKRLGIDNCAKRCRHLGQAFQVD